MNTKMNEMLNVLTDIDSCMIVRPATEKDLKQCQKDMKKMKFPTIPEEYSAFLSNINGFAFNGIEFYSTDQVTDLETNFMLNDIVSANEDFVNTNEGLEHCVLLGRADEDLFVFNTQNNRYEVLDMTGRDVMDDFDNFDDMFVGVVSPRI